MRARLVVVGIGLLATACDRLPGTEAHTIRRGEQAAAALLIDPSSAQFRKTFLRRVPEETRTPEGPKRVVCGEINGKNRQGAYVGFSRFLADPDSEDSFLEPLVNSTEEERTRAGERCQRGARGPIYSEADRELRVMECERALELSREHMEWTEFDMAYIALCEPAPAPPPANGDAAESSSDEQDRVRHPAAPSLSAN